MMSQEALTIKERPDKLDDIKMRNLYYCDLGKKKTNKQVMWRIFV